ncbi:hypothetical protein Scep_010801 [Stephania cephalantha]|uniref:Uncharacterized protein n=1 Tax=Stephania cephalantha TaxID=152367 RepID=A0AAP0JY15_9MAGN
MWRDVWLSNTPNLSPKLSPKSVVERKKRIAETGHRLCFFAEEDETGRTTRARQ